MGSRNENVAPWPTPSLATVSVPPIDSAARILSWSPNPCPASRVVNPCANAAEQANIRFDVVLLDMQMPEMDGYEVASRIRELGYATPLVACTANAMQGDREKCQDAGCVEYLTKPIRKEEMFSIIEKHGHKPKEKTS